MSVRKRWLAAIAAGVLALAVAAPVGAITFGQLDGNAHPWVGAMVVRPRGESPDIWCSGALISPTVFLTAAHCTDGLDGNADFDVFVTFDSAFDAATSTLHPGTPHTNPAYNHYGGAGGLANPGDIAVIVLDDAVGISPAQLPAAGYLDTLSLRSEWFTAVGYGTVREDKTKGFQALFWDPRRRSASQTAMNLIPSWLDLSMNPSTGDGGTCYGDSGGPHFLHDSKLIVSITVTGDAVCRATDKTFRVDTPAARRFLAGYVALP